MLPGFFCLYKLDVVCFGNVVIMSCIGAGLLVVTESLMQGVVAEHHGTCFNAGRPFCLIYAEQTVGGGNTRGLACLHLVVGNCLLLSTDIYYARY